MTGDDRSCLDHSSDESTAATSVNAGLSASFLFSATSPTLDTALVTDSHTYDLAANPLIGQMIGPYQIDGVLGEGGMGMVYRAVDVNGDTVAIKLIKRELARDEIFLRRFDREARIARTIKHPHIVPVLTKGDHDGMPYIAQSFIDSGNLLDRIEREGKLDLYFTLQVCEQVASGLDALHAKGLLHRDVKPANVLLDKDGVAYITDFGLAKDSQGSLLTRPGQALGSIDYMAPEQIRSEDVGPTTDVYALGCVVFECLTGAPPFADRTGMQRVLWAHLQDAPSDPCATRPDISPEVGAAILQALEKDAQLRPQSATEFARLLAHATSQSASERPG
jgi:serine/threonine protein kinase